MGVSDRTGEVRRVAAELWRGGRGPTLVAVAGGWFLSIGTRMVYPALLPYLRTDFGLDLTTARLLITALWVAYALGQLPGGLLDDRVGAGPLLVASTAVSAVMLVLVVAVGSVGTLFAGTVLFDFATALYGVSRLTLLVSAFPDRGGTAVGLVQSAGDVGSSMLPPVGGFLAATFAWEVGLGFAVPLFLLAGVGLHVVVPADGASAEGSADLATTLRRVVETIRVPAVATMVVVQLLGYCVWQSFTAFYPTYLTEVKDVTPTIAAVLFGGVFALGIVVRPVSGAVYDRLGVSGALPFVFAVITVTMTLVPLVDGLPALVVVTVMASSILGYATITLTYLTEVLDDDIQGVGIGSIRTGYMLVGAATPTVVGTIADAGFFDEAFFLLAGVAAAATLLSLFVPEREAAGSSV